MGTTTRWLSYDSRWRSGELYGQQPTYVSDKRRRYVRKFRMSASDTHEASKHDIVPRLGSEYPNDGEACAVSTYAEMLDHGYYQVNVTYDTLHRWRKKRSGWRFAIRWPLFVAWFSRIDGEFVVLGMRYKGERP